jgi:hypothetical protein
MLLAGCAGGDLRHEGMTHVCILAICPHIGVDIDREKKEKDDAK